MDILTLLANSKPAFAGGSERRSLAFGLDRLLPKGKNLNWLEVGVGDGENLLYLLNAVGDGRRFAVTAIDPSTLAAKRIDTRHPVDVLRVGIEEFIPDKHYDCINARQSAYYFEDPSNTFLMLADWLTPDGVLAVTLWSQDCVLYRLNRAIARATRRDDAALRVEDLIKSLPAEKFVVEREREDCGRLDIARLRMDRGAFTAICALAARKIDIVTLTERRLAELFDDLEGPGGQAERSNELLFVRRSP